MSVIQDDPEIALLLERLADYARATLERAAEHATRLHAQELAPEHLLTTLLDDEMAGATRLILHAFADPETLSAEVLALSPGIMVVGSKRTLPFSVQGARALEHAPRETGEAEPAVVDPEHVFLAAWRFLEADQQRDLVAAGAAVSLPETQRRGGGAGGVHEHLLRAFSNEARRSLAAACRIAHRRSRTAIGPVHMICGTLELDGSLRERVGLSSPAVQGLFADRDADLTPSPAGSLRPDARLMALLSGLPQGAGTLDILGWLLQHGSAELRELLRRQRVTRELYEAARGGFEDP